MIILRADITGKAETRFRRHKAAFAPNNAELRKLLLSIGQAQVLFIKQRTEAGIDIHGKPFVDYVNEAYMERRRAYGRPVDHPDLHLTGKMLASFGAKIVKPGVVSIGAGNAGLFAFHYELSQLHDRGRYPSGKKGPPQREHLGFTEDDLKQHRRKIERFMRERFNK